MRQLLDGFTLGNEGFERLELEYRLHAHTFARLTGCRRNEADLKGALREEKKVSSEKDLKIDLIQYALDDETKKSKRRGALNYVLGGLALIASGIAIAK